MPSLKLMPDIFAPTFELKVNGSPLEIETQKSILEVSFTEKANWPSSFSLRMNDPKLKFIGKDDGALREGVTVELSLGYVGNVTKMISGVVTSLTASFPSSGPATLEISGFDALHQATTGTAARDWPKTMLDSEIVSEIASKDLKLSSSVTPTKPRTAARVQYHISNIRFLETLAQDNNYFLWVDDSTLHFHPLRPGKPALLEWGKSLISFSSRLSTVGHVNAIKVPSYDNAQKQPISGRAERSALGQDPVSSTGKQRISQGAAGRSERVMICQAALSSAQEAQTRAEAAMANQDRALVTGNGSCIGDPHLRVGTELELKGIGRFADTYVIEEITHSVGDSGYQTSFQVRRKT